MSTALYELASSIHVRIRELERLTNLARFSESSDEDLYNSVCRAAVVLMSAHLEGFTKEVIRSISIDLNYYIGNFASMPKAMKRAFCRKIAYYENVPSSEIDARINQLIEFFSGNSVPIEMSAFTYKETANNNPKPTFITGAFQDLGVPSVLGSLVDGRFEVVFDNDERTNYKLRRDMKRFQSTVYKFPYRSIPAPYTFNRTNRSPKKGDKSLWEEFIQEILRRRHRVAHGDTLSNETTWEEIHSDVAKLEIIMYGIMYSAADFLSSDRA